MQNAHEKARQIWVLILASLASFMVSLDATVVATALTTIHRDLGVSIANLEWTVNAYTLSFAVLLILAAALGDRFGRRRMFVAGLLLFVGASAACALAHDIGWLIAARTIQGCGAALVAPLALTLLSAAFPLQQRAQAMGIFGSISGLALIAGPVVGGIIAQGLAWQWIFWLNVPIGLLVVTLVLSRVQESFGPRTSLDLGGLLSISGASLGLVWGLVRGNSAGWGSVEVKASLVAGGLLAIVFVAWELRAHAPMVPMPFFRSRAFSAGNAATFLQATSLIGVVFFLSQFFQVAQGNGPLGAGLRLLPLTATLFVVAPLAGALVNQIGEQVLVATGLLLQAIGIAWIGLVAAPGLPYVELIAPLIIAGCGASLSLPATQNAVINAVRAVDIGKASGAFSMFRQLGGAFGVAILAAVFAATGSLGTAGAFSSGFASALFVAAVLSLLGAIAGLVLPGKQVKESEPAERNTAALHEEALSR
ncbi:MFS transporter [Ktedonobacter sp. SOSP1-52]|uniref:DHA2 family efflux MFS transporter permease subunit n=1 Tax=Ktedonobacter sp. SOSP1-52 TaxID=2778366 RepID=UPI0019159D6A|nr:DHA2 family efflux MFS transporter permease subunit [Ktedonobacter sp. SOSP1-52]GHO61775.1 MFS transporter [Ktedonobacter sp. SOSP1-52]